MQEELVNETLTTELEDFVGGTLNNSGKAYGRNSEGVSTCGRNSEGVSTCGRNSEGVSTCGRNREMVYEEDDYLIAKKSMQSALGIYNRHAKPVEVWTKEQKELLKKIEELLARPITPAED